MLRLPLSLGNEKQHDNCPSLQNSALRKRKIPHSENANSVLKNQNSVLKNRNSALRKCKCYTKNCNGALNRLLRILCSKNGNSALKKRKFCSQEWTFSAQRMEIFPNDKESQLCHDFSMANRAMLCISMLLHSSRNPMLNFMIVECWRNCN